MKPAIGRIVHYYSGADYGRPALPHAAPRAAVITYIHTDECVSLAIFDPDGDGVVGWTSVERSDEPAQSHWMWPPRSEPVDLSEDYYPDDESPC